MPKLTELLGGKWDWEFENLKRIGARRLKQNIMPIDEAAYLWEVCSLFVLPSPMKFKLEDVGSPFVLSFWCFEDMDVDENYRRFRKSVAQLAIYFQVDMRLRKCGLGAMWESDGKIPMMVAAESRDIPGLVLRVYEPGRFEDVAGKSESPFMNQVTDVSGSDDVMPSDLEPDDGDFLV